METVQSQTETTRRSRWHLLSPLIYAIVGAVIGFAVAHMTSKLNRKITVVKFEDIERPMPLVSLAETKGQGKKGLGDAVYKKEYDFTADWFSNNLPVWKKALAPFKGKPNLNYLEIGVFEGRSALWMLENILTDPSSRMTGLDMFDGELKDRCMSNLKKSGFEEKVKIIVGPSQEELRKLPLNSYDIIYIDGSHAADDVLEDAVLCWRLLKRGGLLIFDDYLWEPQRPAEAIPKPAIDAFFKFYGNQFDTVHNGYQVFLRKKLKPPPRKKTW